ncbi:venom carboxylesterase-6-like protein, partial [Leptotrombidium deliense]
DPQPLFGWSGTKTADKRVSCPQITPRFRTNAVIQESEDCLYINIFYPTLASGTSRNLPVLVYFHGGEFNYGGKDYYEPEYLLREKDIVLVTVNYRLGVLGFLSTNDTNIPGNFGIKDQKAALNFVFREIDKFNGDNKQITIFGHDAGAISVDIHRLIPEWNAAKFQNAISSGGTIFTPWAMQYEPYDNAVWFAGNLSCSTRTEKILYCLQQKPYSELISMQTKYDFKFRPVVDKFSYEPLLPDDPTRLYQTADFGRHRHLFGLTSKEGSLEYYARYNEYSQLLDNKQKIKRLLEPYFKPYTNKEAISTLIHYKYFDSTNTIPTQADNTLINLLGSYLYESPTDKALREIGKKNAKQSLYVFDYQGKNSFGTLLQPASNINRDTFGVTHMDDIFLIFKTGFSNLEENSAYATTSIVNCIYGFMTDTLDVCRQPYYSGEESNKVFNAINAVGITEQKYNSKEKNEYFKFWNELVFEIELITSTRPPYFDHVGYNSYKAATWSLFAFLIIVAIAIILVIVYIISKKRKEKTSLLFLKKRDKELEERYNFL